MYTELASLKGHIIFLIHFGLRHRGTKLHESPNKQIQMLMNEL